MSKKEIISSLREKNLDILLKDLQETQKKLLDLRFDLFQKKLKNYKEIKKTKKQIARLLSIINEKRRDNGQEN